MAITEYFVAPGGTDDEVGDRGLVIGNPWATPEFALDTGINNIGQGGDGDRLNFAAGSWTLTKNLATCTYFSSFTPSLVKGFFFKGAGSGSSTLDGNAQYSIFSSSSLDYVTFRDLEITNSGANYLLAFDNSCAVIKCKLHGSSIAALDADDYFLADSNEVYDISGFAAIIISGLGCRVIGNYLHGEGSSPTGRWLNLYGSLSSVMFNRIYINTTADVYAMHCTGTGLQVSYNSVYSSVACVGTGIYMGKYSMSITGNLVEGFSGVGGIGFENSDTYKMSFILSSNAAYNCTTPYSGNYTEDVEWAYANDNEILGASPFANAAGGDFTPVDVGNVWGGGWPTGGGSQPDKGAVQRLAGGGNGGGDIYPYPRPRIYGIG